jgi:hypothetical protein
MTITKSYQDSLVRLRQRGHWGSTGGEYAGETVINLLKSRPTLRTVLDYGCGEGSLQKYVEDQGITDREWTLYDPGVRGVDTKPEGKFDLVITTDVLEHVEPEMQDAVITELCGYTDKILFNEIACYATRAKFESGPYIGQDLHINLKVPCIWKQEIEAIAIPLGFVRAHSKTVLIDDWKIRYQSVLISQAFLEGM